MYLLLLLALHYGYDGANRPVASGFSVELLGQLGDSFGPMTAFFAAIAAVGAWLNYDAQREQLTAQRLQLEDEQDRHGDTRFDETFFRLIEYYNRELGELSVSIPESERAFTKPGKRGKVDAVIAFKQSVKVFQLGDQSHGKDTDAFAWGFRQKFFKPLLLLRDQEIAITRWLQRQSANVTVEYRGALLVAKLSDDELWFWYYSIQSTGSADLIAFASELGINRMRALDAESKPEGETENDPPHSAPT
jgi:hypothetical protein